jgi:outer membrane protein
MKKLIIIFIGLVSFGLFGQDNDVPKKWTLEACIQYAYDNNIDIKQSKLDQRDANVNKADAVGNFLPSFNLNANNNWNSGLTQNITTGVLENQVTRNFSLGGTVGIDVSNGLQNWRTLQRAKLAQLASLYSLEQMEDNIALFIANSYLQVLVSKQTLVILQEQNLVTLEQIKLAEAQVEAGTIPEGDVLDLQATNADEQQRIVVARNDVRISLISLAQTLLLDNYESFNIADDSYEVPISDILDKDINEILEKSKEERYEVKIAETNVEIAQKNVELARSAYYPTLRGFFNYNSRESDRERISQTGEVLDPLPFFDQLSRNDGISYGLQLNVPVFNGFATRNNVTRNKIDLERNFNRLQQAELDLESNVYQAYVDAKGAAKSYEAAQKTVLARQTAYNYAKERFDVGMSNSFELSQSKLNLTNAQNTLIRAKYDYIFGIKVLELFFGIRPVE